MGRDVKECLTSEGFASVYARYYKCKFELFLRYNCTYQATSEDAKLLTLLLHQKRTSSTVCIDNEICNGVTTTEAIHRVLDVYVVPEVCSVPGSVKCFKELVS